MESSDDDSRTENRTNTKWKGGACMSNPFLQNGIAKSTILTILKNKEVI